MKKKAFFVEPSAGEIRKRSRHMTVDRIDLAEALLDNLGEDRYVLLDKRTCLTWGFESDRKFRRHAPPIVLLPSYLTQEALRALTEHYARKRAKRDRSAPLWIREASIPDKLNPEYLPSGFLVHPALSYRDKVPRKIPMHSVVEGHRIFATQEVRIIPYAGAEKVATEGAYVAAHVPSMHEGKDYVFALHHIPVLRNEHMLVIASALGSDHDCGAKHFGASMKYRYSDDPRRSEERVLCKHEMAALLGTVQHYAIQETPSDVLLQNMFPPLISRTFARGAARALDSLLVEDDNAQKGVRRPRAGELEATYWLLVHELGASNALYSDRRRDGLVINYDWTMRH